jgi:hypothetical protein
MKLAAVYFDDTVCIPGGKDVGGGASRQDLRESTFSAADGWQIDWDGHVLFTIWREGMPSVAKVGGYGFTFVAEAAPSSVGADTALPAAVADAGTNPKRRRK